jgi:hypothetical protein
LLIFLGGYFFSFFFKKISDPKKKMLADLRQADAEFNNKMYFIKQKNEYSKFLQHLSESGELPSPQTLLPALVVGRVLEIGGRSQGAASSLMTWPSHWSVDAVLELCHAPLVD